MKSSTSKMPSILLSDRIGRIIELMSKEYKFDWQMSDQRTNSVNK